MKYANLATDTNVPQSEPLNERQVQNNAGGFVFAVDDWTRLARFLILGSDAPTYYQKARDLTRQNAACVERCYAADARRTVDFIVDISMAGRAPKNDPAIFALALGIVAARDDRTRSLALRAVPKVCRTGTHLFQFVMCARALGRGWGRGLKTAVAGWYDNRTVESVAYQAIKYRQREGYTHKRLLDTARPHEYRNLYRWMKGKECDVSALPAMVRAHMAAMKVDEAPENQRVKILCALVERFELPWEALPTWALTNADVWRAMVPTMGLTALIRNLGNMSRHGAITPLSETEKQIVARLGDREELKHSRVHPFALLQAMSVYGSGKGFRGDGSWPVSQRIVDALDLAFYSAFSNVEPTGKRFFIGVDVSGSMSSPFGGSPLTCAEVAASLALVTMATEKNCEVFGFADGLRDLQITPRMRMDGVLRKTRNVNFGGTDCSLPMIYALRHGIPVDAFLVITDNETWAGNKHPVVALKEYRQRTGIPAKLIVLGITSTGFSIADPNDGGMLDCVGMDSSVPELIADFVRN